LTIESRQKFMRVAYDAIEQVTETMDGRLSIVYFVGNTKGTAFTKKTATFECFEVAEIIKTFQSIRTIVETQGGSSRGESRSFTGTQMFSKGSKHLEMTSSTPRAEKRSSFKFF
jgi:hypothetical protein